MFFCYYWIGFAARTPARNGKEGFVLSTRSVNKPLQPPRRDPQDAPGRPAPPERAERPLKILTVTSEAIPFAKTGGLADVCGALPRALAELGHEAAVIMPAYRQALRGEQPIEPTGIELTIPIGTKKVTGRLLKSHLPDSSVPVYLVQQDQYYDRPELYTARGQGLHRQLRAVRLLLPGRAGGDSAAGSEGRRAALQRLADRADSGVPEDRIPRPARLRADRHAVHDPQPGLPGQFWHWDMLLTGLDWKYFNWHQMEFFGHLNLMKTGLVFADALNTVSPRYAQEIQSSPLGCGLEGVLSQRRKVLTGIINGVDYREWNPATDRHLPATLHAGDGEDGQGAVQGGAAEGVGAGDPPRRAAGRLCRPADGPERRRPDRQRDPAMGPHQRPAMGDPGHGRSSLSAALLAAGRSVSAKSGGPLEFADPLAHRIEAGADMFLMPSSFEPCGLSQLYSLKYGTVPVVRATGGLADTIVDCTPETLATKTANGFSFREYTALALSDTLRRAWDAYANQPTWDQLIATGMQQDWSWHRSAKQYVELYEETLVRVNQAALV